jgi:hypothetical protein
VSSPLCSFLNISISEIVMRRSLIHEISDLMYTSKGKMDVKSERTGNVRQNWSSFFAHFYRFLVLKVFLKSYVFNLFFNLK